MASIADNTRVSAPTSDDRFFVRGAIVIALTIVAGFSLQLAMGRSTFYSPPLVHAHAIVFMGWVAIYLTQNLLIGSGRVDIHRKLGWIAVGWIFPMVLLGCLVTLAMERRGQIVVETQLDPANSVVRVIVADNGPGIPVGEREKLFLPYYSTKRRGSGLGLAIVRRIIAEHGGSIDVGDNTPRGTRFTIELPC